MLRLLTIKNCPLFICSECRHVAVNDERHKEHLREPRHVHHYRFMAYKDPKRRKMWLKLWLKEIERAEEEFPVLFNIDELEEFQERGYHFTS